MVLQDYNNLALCGNRLPQGLCSSAGLVHNLRWATVSLENTAVQLFNRAAGPGSMPGLAIGVIWQLLAQLVTCCRVVASLAEWDPVLALLVHHCWAICLSAAADQLSPIR